MNDTPEGRRGADPGAGRIEELVEPLLGPAYGFCLRLTRSPEDAEDLVQEAALRACRAFGTYRQGTNFKAWFFKIVMNLFYERFRRKRPEDAAIAFDQTSERFLYRRARETGPFSQAADPARDLLRRLDTERIEAALMDLPDEFRAVCNMYFIEDFTYEEIADMLDIPIGTVRSRLHRGRKLLQRRLWDIALEQGIVTAGGEEGL